MLGILNRKSNKGRSKVRAKVIADTKIETLQPEIRATVEPGSRVLTDAWTSYRGLGADYQHEVINHAVEYVRGTVHTNGIENFWSLLKRTIKGTYVSVEPYHLGRYLDEQTFRFNERDSNDSGRFRSPPDLERAYRKWRHQCRGMKAATPRKRGKGTERSVADKVTSTMDRFKSLTQKIILVPRSAINEQERIYNEDRERRKRPEK